LISQRPSELSPQALSQCGTIFALRLANEIDQRFMETLLQDGARGSLARLSSLGTQEAVVCGEGVPLPMRIRFDDLVRTLRPRSDGADFAKAGQSGSADAQFRDEGVRRWRQQSRKPLPV
jgi:DNA helicase HerA-like ATPase